MIDHAIEGTGKPLVYLLPALAHVKSKSFPAIAGRKTITIAHAPESIDAWADDVVSLLARLGIGRADFLGQSFGGAAATTIALRHPELVDRVATYGTAFGPSDEAHDPRMLDFDAPPTPNDRAFEHFRKSHGARWPAVWEHTMRIRWKGFSRDDLASIAAPILLLAGDRDFVRLEHVVATLRILPNAELAVIPDAGHFALFSEPERVLPIVMRFFDSLAPRAPVATARMGYHPGETR